MMKRKRKRKTKKTRNQRKRRRIKMLKAQKKERRLKLKLQKFLIQRMSCHGTLEESVSKLNQSFCVFEWWYQCVFVTTYEILWLILTFGSAILTWKHINFRPFLNLFSNNKYRQDKLWYLKSKGGWAEGQRSNLRASLRYQRRPWNHSWLPVLYRSGGTVPSKSQHP